MNAAQLKAVTHLSGPAIVLAGPGSGKTFVIVERLRHLITERNIPPYQILVITFTKAAAIEMQYRFLKLTDNSYPEVVFGTFHSVFYQIIRNSKSKNQNKIELADDKLRSEIIRDAISFARGKGLVDDRSFDEALSEIPDILSEISRIKNMGISPNDAVKTLSVSGCFEDIFSFYNRRLIEFGVLDFDDMIVRCLKLLEDNPGILKMWQERFKYILIDEYQDINMVQYKVVRLLLGDDCNIFAVGDDDQSIYGFRGSDPSIMLDFKESFVEYSPEFINLNYNYRCGSEILGNALKVIDENKIRFKKELIASENNGRGALTARRYESRQIQNENIAKFLLKHMDHLSDIAILYRTNSEAMKLATVLKDNGIPSNLEERTKSTILDPCVELCIAYMSFALKGHKRSDFYKIINKPMRYISRECAMNEVVSEKEVLRYYAGNKHRCKTVREFFRHIDMISHLRPSLMMRYMRRSIGLDSVCPKSNEALNYLEEIAVSFMDTGKFLDFLIDKRDEEADNKATKKKCDTGGNRVKIMTMHGSKGLEFEIVWLPDLNEGILPARSAVTPAQIEEERRMLYVAMTRAKKALIMSYITGTEENKMLPTRFLKPIRDLWEKNYKSGQTSSDPSSGSSTSSSNSTSSR